MVDLVGDFLGSTIFGSFSQTPEPVYCILDMIFIFIILISFYLYLKMYQYVKNNFPESMATSFGYILVALSLINVIFMGILAEFIMLRKYQAIQLPLISRLIWLVLAVSAFVMMTKAYMMATTEGMHGNNVKIRKRRKSKEF